jgi:hypothetical protein
MLRFILLTFGVALATLLSAQPASTFFSTFDAERGNALAPASDGNLWLGGMKDERVMLTKISLGGQVLSTHDIGFQGTGLDTENLVEFFEDTDGTLVGCGNFENDNLGRGFVFRYDPAARKVLWAHIVRSGDLNYLFGIVPLGPGGDYVLYGNPHNIGLNDAELLRLNRATGQVMANKSVRLDLGSSDNFSQIVYHQGALYACGRFTNDNAGFNDFARMRNVLCKLDTATLQPVWTRIGPLPSSTLARLYGRDLVIDNDAIVSTFSGDATGPDLFSSTIFLQKNDLAGNLLWAKQYNLPVNGEFAEEVISLPDGYMLFAHELLSDTSQLFLLKTDKQGNPLSAVAIRLGANDKFSETPARSKILRMGDALFLTAFSQNALGQTQGLLAKTDLEGRVGDSCAFFQKIGVQTLPLPSPVSEVVVPKRSAISATLTPAVTTAGLPDLVFSKKCGASGSCPTLPDLRITLDSVSCNDGNPLLHYTFCNAGGQPYEGSAFLGVYDKNPFTGKAQMLTTIIHTGNSLAPGDCLSGSVGSDLSAAPPFQLDGFSRLYAVMGVSLNAPTPISLSSFPFPPNQPECAYLNNLDSIAVPQELCGSCEKPLTFIKTLGDPQRREQAYSMCKSADGSLYLLGKQDASPMIAKINSRGEPIWVRNFPGSSFFPTELAEIIEDSDRMLVLCGTAGSSSFNRHAVAMRYDPVTDQVLWSQQYPANRPAASGILEKSPGGNFLLSSNSQEIVGLVLKTRSELLELDRTTGTVLPSLAVRYLGEPHLRMEDMAMSNGDLYATGSWQTGAQQFPLSIFAKISASTGQPEWAFQTDPDSTATGPKFVTPGALLIDGDLAFITGAEDIDPAAPATNGSVYLEKRRTDGSLVWMRRYSFKMLPQDVIRTENAVVVFGVMLNNRWGMMKADIQTGDLIAAKMLDLALPSNNFADLENRKGRVLRMGLDILMLDHTNEGIGGDDFLLLRTDTNFNLDDTCSLLRSASVSVATRPAKSQPVTFQAVQTMTTAGAWPQIFQPNSLNVSKLCPRCDCEGVPDIIFQVNRIACTADSSLVYKAEVCNLGKALMTAPVEVTFFDKNPLTEAAQPVWSIVLMEPLGPGACSVTEWPLPGIALQYPKLYSLVGVGSNVVTPVKLSDFPFLQGVAECDYVNNLDSFVVKTPVCDGCENPTTFFKTMGRADQSEWGYSLCRASDGNVYMAGRQGDSPMIAKMTPNGEMIWVRNFPAENNPFDKIDWVEIIEDSEGKIVLCGTRDHSPNTRKTVAMRYDPLTNQVLWFKDYAELNPEAQGIFEKTAGGNFVVYAFSDEIFNGGPLGTYYRSRSQVWEVNRTTGEVVPGLATYFSGSPSSSTYFQDMVMHEGSLYCVGGWGDEAIPNSGRAMLAKLSPNDGTPEWIQGTLPDTLIQFRFFNWRDLLIDSNFIMTMGYGLTGLNTPEEKGYVLLGKYKLDGTLLWVKSYEAPLSGYDLVSLPEGYAVFGYMDIGTWGMLKVDKEGNLLTAKQMFEPGAVGFHSGFYRQNQLLRLPNHFLMINDYRPNAFSDIVLLKTDLNFNLDDSCSLLKPLAAPMTVRAAKSNPILTPFGPYGVKAANRTAVFQTDSLNIRQLCPQCPCTDKPDLTCRATAVYCAPDGGATAFFQICNQGLVSASEDFALTFYDKNPLAGAAAPLHSVIVPVQPGFGDCVEYQIQLDTALTKYPKLYTLAGVWKDVQTPISLADFPFPNGYAECDYANNVDSFLLDVPDLKVLDLGPDRSICQGQTVTLDAGSGYVLYDWLDGSSNGPTNTVGATGNYAVEVVDDCGRKQRDTVRVTIFPYPKRTVNIVLLPGDSVLIGGKTYKGTTSFVDTIPSLSGPCDTVTTYHIRLDSLHCTGKADAFLQADYQENERFIGRVVLPASDGSIYTGGENHFLDWQFVLTKTAANGQVLWSRGFNFANSSQNAAIIDHLIEDSEGKLVGTFTQVGVAGGKLHFTVFRYDPQSDQLLWVKNVRTTEAASVPRILAEIKAGGNFVVAYSLASVPQGTFSELCELDRATGNPIGNSARRYGPGVTFLGGTVHQGILYANGLVRDTTTSSIAAKNGYVKIDLSTGQVIDQKILKTVSGGNVTGQAMAVGQDGHLVSLLFSADTAIWLRKTTLSGEVLWLKQYRIKDLPLTTLNTVGVSAVSDGYVFALEFFAANSQYIGSGLLKAGLDGNILWAKQFDALGVLWGRSPQIVQARGEHIYMTGVMNVPSPSSPQTTGALVAKLDKDGNAGQDCGFFKNISVSVSDQASIYEPAVVGAAAMGRLSENVPNGPRIHYDLDIYTRCSRCLDPCAITLALPPYLSLCPGDTLLLQAQEDFAEFAWQDGSTGRSLVVAQPGLYHVRVKDKCGAEQRDSVTVGWATPPVVQKIVVLLPGESIVIAGNTYSAPAKFEVTIPSKTGICDTVAQYTVVVSPSGCAQPRAFLKSFDGPQSRVLAADRNNGAYLLGESQDGATTLTRFDSTGQLLWAREIIKNLGGPGGYAYPVSLIQDSDGMLTGCGSYSNSGQIVAFRYDPVAQQMLWLKTLQSEANFTTDTPHDILEEKPGGHFLLLAEHSESSMVGTPFFKSEIMRLDRATGALIGPANRYGLSRFREAIVRDNALYITGTLQDPSVADNNSGGLLKIDLTTDQVLWAKRMTLLWPNSYGGEDLLIDADGNIVSLMTRLNEFVLQKNSPDGSLIWQRKYTVDFPTAGGVLGHNIRLLQDGDYALALNGNFSSGLSILIAKISKDGPVKWAKLHRDLKIYASLGTQWLDVHDNTIYFTHGATEYYSTLFGKFDASGNISDACQLAEDIKINYASSFIGQISSAPPVESRAKTLFTPNTSAPVALDYKAKFRCIQCESICDTIRVTKTLQFYPGDTITIDGKAYTQPGTVVQTFTTPAGCDSVVTTDLQLVVTDLQVKCPADLTVTLPPNQTTTVVDYPLPTAVTDCPNPAIALKLLQGLPVGGAFPQGATQVCYEAANQCGIRDTCCFTITANAPDDAPCDAKAPVGCLRYELLSIRLDALGQRWYRVRVTNTCASPLEFAYVQLPQGVLAVSPKEGATYASPGGNAYAVRNPNASPFYSVRYKAVAGNLNNGESDIFEHTLPQQSAPAYIHVSAKLADGSTSSAHLNTFFCPVLPYDGTQNAERTSNFKLQTSNPQISNLSVWPSPTSGVLFTDLSFWRSQSLRLQVLNAQGQVVLTQQVLVENGPLEVTLPSGLASGLYYLTVLPERGEAAAARFVVER